MYNFTTSGQYDCLSLLRTPAHRNWLGRHDAKVYPMDYSEIGPTLVYPVRFCIRFLLTGGLTSNYLTSDSLHFN